MEGFTIDASVMQKTRMKCIPELNAESVFFLLIPANVVKRNDHLNASY